MISKMQEKLGIAARTQLGDELRAAGFTSVLEDNSDVPEQPVGLSPESQVNQCPLMSDELIRGQFLFAAVAILFFCVAPILRIVPLFKLYSIQLQRDPLIAFLGVLLHRVKSQITITGKESVEDAEVLLAHRFYDFCRSGSVVFCIETITTGTKHHGVKEFLQLKIGDILINQLVQTVIGIHVHVEIIGNDGICNVFSNRLDFLCRNQRTSSLGGIGLQKDAQFPVFINLFSCDRCHDRTVPGDTNYEAIIDQHIQCFSDRRPADLKIGSEFVFGKSVIGGELSRHDLIAQVFIDLFAERVLVKQKLSIIQSILHL